MAVWDVRPSPQPSEQAPDVTDLPDGEDRPPLLWLLSDEVDEDTVALLVRSDEDNLRIGLRDASST